MTTAQTQSASDAAEGSHDVVMDSCTQEGGPMEAMAHPAPDYPMGGVGLIVMSFVEMS